MPNNTLSLVHFDEPLRATTNDPPYDSMLNTWAQAAGIDDGGFPAIAAGGVFGNCGEVLVRTSSLGLFKPTETALGFTLEFRFKPGATGTGEVKVALLGDVHEFQVLLNPQKVVLKIGEAFVEHVFATPLSSWESFALVSDNGVVYTLFVGGQPVETLTPPIPMVGSFSFVQVASEGFTGYVDELRVSSIPRYHLPYEPAHEPFMPVYAGEDSTYSYLTQLAAVDDQRVEEDLVTNIRVPQVYGVVPDSSEAPLPAFTSSIPQVYGIVATETASEPLPIFATYLTQLRNVHLIGELIDAPKGLNVLTQLRIFEVSDKAEDRPLVMVTYERMSLTETEPADWMRVNSIRNMVVRQDTLTGTSNIYALRNSVVLLEEAPIIGIIRNRAAISILTEPATYPDPEGLSAETISHALAQIAVEPEVYPDPQDLRSSTTLRALTRTAVVHEAYPSLDDIMPGASSRALSRVAVTAEDYPDPELLAVPTTARTVTQVTVTPEEYPDPQDLRSMARARSLVSITVRPEDYPDPQDLRSASTSFAVIKTLVEPEEYPDPETENAALQSHVLAATTLEPLAYRDPADISPSATSYKLARVAITEETYPDPQDLRSKTRSRALSTVTVAPEEYPDPNLMYQYPIASHALAFIVMEPMDYESLGGYWQPIVNVNYYWRAP